MEITEKHKKFVTKYLAPLSILLSIHPTEHAKIFLEIDRFNSTDLTELSDRECDVLEIVHKQDTALLWNLIEQCAFRKRRAIVAASGCKGQPVSDKKRAALKRNIEKRWANRSVGDKLSPPQSEPTKLV